LQGAQSSVEAFLFGGLALLTEGEEGVEELIVRGWELLKLSDFFWGRGF
jgi:hypothetical protein